MSLNLLNPGYGEGVSEDQARASWASWNPGSPQSSTLSESLRSLVSNLGSSAYSPDGRYMIARNDERNGGYYESGSDVWNWTTTPTYRVYDTTQGAGEAIRVYDAEGKYLRDDAGAGIIGQLRGVLLVAGAAAGFSAVGASTAGGAAATTATTTAAPTAAAEGSATFGGGLGIGEGTAGASYGLSGASTYGGATIGTAESFASALASGAGYVAGDPLTYAKGAVSLASGLKSAAGLFGGSGGGSARNGAGTFTLPVSPAASGASKVLIPVAAGSGGPGDSSASPDAVAKPAGTAQTIPPWLIFGAAILAGIAVASFVRKK